MELKFVDDFLKFFNKEIDLVGLRYRKSGFVRNVKLCIFAGQAASGPPLGLVLGQYNINAVSFCKQFNEATKYLDPSILLVVDISVYADKAFVFTLRKPTLSYLVKSFQFTYNRQVLYFSEIIYIARFKFTSLELKSAIKAVFATVRSMRVLIKFDE